jgi:hypothetical protein
MNLDENLVGAELRMRAVENLEPLITEARDSHPGFHPLASRVQGRRFDGKGTVEAIHGRRR